MKIRFKNFLIYSLIIFCAGYAYGQSQVKPKVEQAYATQWGGCPGAYAQCPGTSGPIDSCVDSADFDVTINSIGDQIPAGQQFIIRIEPADGSGDSCSNVTCLKRTTTFQTASNPDTSSGWPAGQTSWKMPLFNQIGCDGQCTPYYKVTASFDGQPLTSENCPNPPVPVTIQNGVSNAVPVYVNCIPPISLPSPSLSPSPSSTSSVCPVPNAVANVKIDCPYCQ